MEPLLPVSARSPMTVRVFQALLAGLLLAAAGPLAAEAEPRGDLPPEECVQKLRSAHLAAASGSTEAALEMLHAAAEACPGELAPIHALLEHDRVHGLPEGERQRLLDRLRRRLADPEQALSPAILQQLARDPGADQELLRELAEGVSRRLEAAAGEPSPGLLTVLAEIQTRMGDDEGAADTLERLRRRNGGKTVTDALIQLHLRLKRWPEALALIEAADARGETYRWLRIELLSELGRVEEARPEAERLAAELAEVRPDPERESPELLAIERARAAELLERLAWSFVDTGRDAEAEALLRRALALVPDSPELAAALLHLYGTEEERRAHAAEVARGWEVETDPRALFDEGSQRLASGDAEGAFELLHRAAPRLPYLEAAWFNLGMAAYRLERWPEVVEALGRAARLNSSRSASFFFRGVALVYLERCDEAVAALERALELDPSRVQGHYYLAGCYRALGRGEEAERHRRRYEAARGQ